MSTPKPRGRRADHPGGRRSKHAGTTLNEVERKVHEAWLRKHGWPAVPEVTIVRKFLTEAWHKDGVAPPDLVNAA